MAISDREQRGMAIATLTKLEEKHGLWTVPSQGGNGKYIVRDHPEHPFCSCPDHDTRGVICKHIFAVRYTIKREVSQDETGAVTETVTETMTVVKKKTYQQDWVAYNAAQSVEKDRFQELLFDLCQGVQEPEHNGRGRKPHLAKDSIFSMAFKIYSTLSGRRFSSDLREAFNRGFLTKEVPGLKVNIFLENPAFTPVLKELIVKSSLPLRTVETTFAIDSSGFSSSVFDRWFDMKHNKARAKATWVKVHVACGTKTNVVTAVRILDRDSADSPQFVPLLQETAQGFTVGEMSADKAYGSLENFEAVAACGGTGFIAFKSRTTGGIGGMFQKMFHYFQFRQEEYLQHYHRRSNVESTFSMIKRKFGDSVRARTDVAMANEVLCKILAHNICCLIQEQHELGIEPIFFPAQAQPAILELRRYPG